MLIKSLKITDFKNIPSATLCFAPKINAFLGDNGMGKSNLLDALHYLSFCKSFTGMTDRNLVRSGQEFSLLAGDYLRRGEDTSLNVALWANGRRKSFRRDGKEYQRLSAHIGMFPLVMVSPADLDLVNGPGDVRRRFIDQSIAQGNPVYLDHLMRYANALEQRNRLLRDDATDKILYDALENTLVASGMYIANERRLQTKRLAEIHNRYYREIAGAENGEHVELTYNTSWGDNLADAIERARPRDRVMHHTTVGPHRDDIVFTLNNMPLRQTASQGQQKTFTIALRLAQYSFLKDSVSMSPLLLLDDIFDKLDANRVSAIVDIVRNNNFGQIFITDTNLNNLHDILDGIGGDGHSLWHVKDGLFDRR